MAKYNQLIDNNFGSDAEFRAWCQAIDAALKVSGFLVDKTDETGQIDLATVVRPAANVYAGYRMYKADDALQATKPFFVKMEYGCGANTSRGTLRVTMSTSTNGSGTPGGFVSVTLSIMSAGADGSGACRIFGSGDDTHTWFAQWDTGISTQCGGFIIGRSVLRSDLSPTDDISYFAVMNTSTGSAWGTLYYGVHSSAWASLAFENTFPRPDDAPNNGGDVNVSYLFDAIMYRAGRILTFPWVVGRATELPYTDPDGGAFAINVWGAARTFTPLPWTTNGGSLTGRPCMAWNA